ncbi:MAG TPA: type I DNA topoisomerase [Thermomicrobiales bacterium]|nr:type I DNA topoisomerase [Thermomicrobiales bacterium]
MTGTTRPRTGAKSGTTTRKKPPSPGTKNVVRKGTSARARATTTGKRSGATRLVIVESPAKARTIERYLGRGYSVRASMGHVRDLPKSTLGIQIDDDFQPKYMVPRDKLKTMKELKELVQGATEVILATDPDREGEAIAWHLVQATQPADGTVRRVVFNEITPNAVRRAMENPREIDMDLVDAQQARRILDRLVGYSISPLLWKKVKSGLSAGRVQSVALRLVVEREREIQEFVSREYWSLDAELEKRVTGKRPSFTASLSRVAGKKADLPDAATTDAIVRGLSGAEYSVADVQVKETQRRPAAPFTTSTLQQEASRKLSLAVRRTMQIAQELYEGVDLGPDGTQGLITYMRTDSTNVAASAQAQAKDAIARFFGGEFVPERPPVYTRRSKGAQEAHEAIRPTDPARHPDTVKQYLSQPQLRLYRLVWQRFIASQMRNAIFDNTGVDIDAGPAGGDKPYRFRATGSVIKFQGFLAVYREGRDDDDEVDEIDRDALPELSPGEILDLIRLVPEQHFTQPPPRFTEATLVKSLEENGIGRPSTYAPTIATLLARNYVTIEQRRLVPTELGFVVNDILVEHFPSIVDIGFTSGMEEQLDEIAAGDRQWAPVIRAFYGPFAESVGKAEQTMERVRVRDEPTDEVCEQCGSPMVIKLGKFGRFIACSAFPACRNAKPLLTRIGVPCPQCREGDIVERRTKKGRVFYGCSRYPECDFSAWSRPISEACPRCGGVMILVGKSLIAAKCQKCDYRMTVAPAQDSERIPA